MEERKKYKDLADKALESAKTFDTNHPDKADAMFTISTVYQNKVMISL